MNCVVCDTPCKAGWGWGVSGPEHPHLPFHDTFIDYTRFPHVDEAHFYEDAAGAYQNAVANVTDAYEHAAWRYLNAIRDDVVYGYGSPFHVHALRPRRGELDGHGRVEAQARPRARRAAPGEPLAPRARLGASYPPSYAVSWTFFPDVCPGSRARGPRPVPSP